MFDLVRAGNYLRSESVKIGMVELTLGRVSRKATCWAKFLRQI
jgi:hypothetical protein